MDILLQVLSVSLIIAALVQLYFFFSFFVKLAKYSPEEKKSFNAPVSVVICGKNEAENIRNNLPLILNQDYQEFEVLFVNDGSTDETETILEELKTEYGDKLNVLFIDPSDKKGKGKKFPLTKGIEASKYEYILLTDADCHPSSSKWITLMTRHFADSDVVLGVGLYKHKGGILNKLIRFETFTVALQYLSFALRKKTYMGVGRNLAYKKAVFKENNGFDSHDHLTSGDDDLFINALSGRYNIAIEMNYDALTYSEPKLTWKSFFRQKIRHLSVGSAYNRSTLLWLGVLTASNLVFYTSIITALILNKSLFVVCLLLILRMIQHFYLNKRFRAQFGGKDLLYLSLPLEVLSVIINVFVGFFSWLIEIKKWE